jgi:hypothetical protein
MSKSNPSNFTYYRTLSNGQRGEVYETNGDQVAVIFEPPAQKLHDGDETSKEEDANSPSIYWVDGTPLLRFTNS